MEKLIIAKLWTNFICEIEKFNVVIVTKTFYLKVGSTGSPGLRVLLCHRPRNIPHLDQVSSSYLSQGTQGV